MPLSQRPHQKEPGWDSAMDDFSDRKHFRNIQILNHIKRIYCVAVPRSGFNPDALKVPELNGAERCGPN